MTINAHDHTMRVGPGGLLQNLPEAAWLDGAADLAWLTPSTNNIRDPLIIDPLAETTNKGNTGPAAIFNAWTGFSYGQRILAAASGGHQDYRGNEIYEMDTAEDAPHWVRRRDATPSEGGGVGDFPEWSDGTPSSSHQYVQNIEAEGRHFLCGLGSHNYAGNASAKWWEVDTSSWQYIDRGVKAALAGHTTGGVTAAYDENTREIVLVGNNNSNPSTFFYGLDTLNETLSVSSDINWGSYITCAVDPVNHYLLVWTGIGIYVMDLDNRAAGYTIITPTSEPAAAQINRWSWHVNGFIMYNGSNLVKLTPTDAAWSGGNYSTVATTGTAPGDTSGEGIRGKQGICEVSGRRVLFVNANYNTGPDTYALPLTAGGV